MVSRIPCIVGSCSGTFTLHINLLAHGLVNYFGFLNTPVLCFCKLGKKREHLIDVFWYNARYPSISTLVVAFDKCTRISTKNKHRKMVVLVPMHVRDLTGLRMFTHIKLVVNFPPKRHVELSLEVQKHKSD